jgi:hypothetical protein|nr:MAG TPA: Amicyanin [Caudoviricetes sp.]
MDFPQIKPPVYPIHETIPDTAIKGKLENQVILARKRFTRTPMTFELTWTALPESDYEKLRAFYREVNAAVSFRWVYPVGAGGAFSGRAFTVRFDGEFSFSCANHGYWEGSIKLTEV